MGLLSGIIKGVGRVAQTIRDLPGKVNRWDLSRDVKRNTKPVQTTEIPVVDVSFRRHAKRQVSAPESVNAELEALRKKTAELQRQNEMLIRAIQNGGKIGGVKASSDPAKLEKQQRVADAIDEARKNSGAMPGTQEYEELRAGVLEDLSLNEDYIQSPDDPEGNDEYYDVLTEEEQSMLNQGLNPWYTP